jgi:hypothetical protein
MMIVVIIVQTDWLNGPINSQTNLYNSVLYKSVVQKQTVSTYDTISSRKFQSLGKYEYNENMSKAACLAIILAYATEEETVHRKR